MSFTTSSKFVINTDHTFSWWWCWSAAVSVEHKFANWYQRFAISTNFVSPKRSAFCQCKTSVACTCEAVELNWISDAAMPAGTPWMAATNSRTCKLSEKNRHACTLCALLCDHARLWLRFRVLWPSFNFRNWPEDSKTKPSDLRSPTISFCLFQDSVLFARNLLFGRAAVHTARLFYSSPLNPRKGWTMRALRDSPLQMHACAGAMEEETDNTDCVWRLFSVFVGEMWCHFRLFSVHVSCVLSTDVATWSRAP